MDEEEDGLVVDVVVVVAADGVADVLDDWFVDVASVCVGGGGVDDNFGLFVKILLVVEFIYFLISLKNLKFRS